ncbi:Ldh family oxidoreductase [Arthrobacter sp. efr-133-TYG-118]|uniref:Ldh family oxidoreductase n=1 Tax=Arthrobacter sp. efr-133-TYG-118 TaxID=3040279 RepID=UPI00254BB68C|nr:Ldh family oxidoreductase [Arthrobacter sp. efr-133-TYG-118]
MTSSRAEPSRSADGTIACPPEELRRFTASVLTRIGMTAQNADFMAGVIVASDLAGHESHGIRRLPEYVDRWRAGNADPGAEPVVELDNGAVLRLNGRRAYGHIALRDAVDIATQRAREHGIAAVAIRRAEHAGRLADFCERAAAAGIALFLFANDAGGGQDVAPPGASQARMATNPIAIGVPRERAPHLVLDMSTSVVAAGRLAEWRDRGEPIPSDWVTESGVLRPMGGVKGFGLALMVEALAGVLTGAGAVSANPEHDDQGTLVIALDIRSLCPVADFVAQVEEFIAYVRAVPLEPGSRPIQMPGEGGARTSRERSAGGVPIQGFAWQRMQSLAAEFGVPLPIVHAPAGA